MALKLWQSVDGNWNTGASWGGIKPAAGDDILFSVDAGGTNVAVTTSNDQTVTNFNSITVDESFTKDIFASGTPLKCTCNVIHHRGAGTFYFQDEDNLSGVTDSTDIVVCDSPFDSLQAMVLSGNAIDRLVVQAGGVKLTDAAVIDAFLVPSLSRRFLGRTSLESNAGNAGITNLIMTGGVFTHTAGNSGTPANIWQFGGEIPVSSGMSGTLRVILGGTHNAGKTAGPIGSHFDDLFVLGGTYDYSSLPATAPNTVSGDFIIGPNGTLRRRSSQMDPIHNSSGDDINMGKTEIA